MQKVMSKAHLFALATVYDIFCSSGDQKAEDRCQDAQAPPGLSMQTHLSFYNRDKKQSGGREKLGLFLPSLKKAHQGLFLQYTNGTKCHRHPTSLSIFFPNETVGLGEGRQGGGGVGRSGGLMAFQTQQAS